MKAAFEKISGATHGSFVARRISLPAFDHAYHFHPELELAWIESGHGRRFVGDSIETFRAGDLVLLGANLPHLFFTDLRDSEGPQWARATVIQFRPDVFGTQFLNLPDMKAVSDLLGRAARGLHFSAKASAVAGPAMAALTHAAGPARIIGFLSVLDKLSRYRARPLSSRGFRPELRTADMERIHRTIAWVHEHFRDPIFLADAARIAALAPAAFCRFFKRATGRTFSAFVNEVRVARACRLLAQTTNPVAEIAFDCGFGALSNFNQKFSAIKQMPPREFRRRFRDAAGEPGR